MRQSFSVALAALASLALMGCGPKAPQAQVKNLGLKMLCVREGTFQRDAAAGNTTEVSAFHMGEKEITRAEYRTIMGTDPSDSAVSIGDEYPAQKLSWYDAVKFCNALSEYEGLEPFYTIAGTAVSVADWEGEGYRLPTEMEWMWAAMGGSSGRFEGYNGAGVYERGYTKAFAGQTGSSWRSDIEYNVWYADSQELEEGESGIANPVGQKGANELGLFDMSGNVWEWCWDQGDGRADIAVSGALEDYRGEGSGEYRARRGGAYDSETRIMYDPATEETEYYAPPECALAYRGYAAPDAESADTGLRVVRNCPNRDLADKYAIGGTGPGGGVIFYLEDGCSGQHGLEAAPYDWNGAAGDPLAYWESQAESGEELHRRGDEEETDVTSIGTGATNTAALALVRDSHPAAQLCADYAGGGKSDWFLPSADELYAIYWNLVCDKSPFMGGGTPYLSKINQNGLGGFSVTDEEHCYWTSSPVGDWGVEQRYFDNGMTSNAYSSNDQGYVRPVRAF